MRTARLLGEGRSFYHCVSRVVGRKIVFKDRDKAVFRKMMRSLEAFLGVKVVTYCFMGKSKATPALPSSDRSPGRGGSRKTF